MPSMSNAMASFGVGLLVLGIRYSTMPGGKLT